MDEESEQLQNDEESKQHESLNESKEHQKKHVCEFAGCGAKFLRPNRLKIHYRTHTGEVNIL